MMRIANYKILIITLSTVLRLKSMNWLGLALRKYRKAKPERRFFELQYILYPLSANVFLHQPP